MNEVYYRPDVKTYDPMGRDTMDGIGIVFNSSEILNPTYSQKCLDYNPINKKPSFYQPGYKIRVYSETPFHTSQKSFDEKETKVMNYQPGERAKNGRSYQALFKGVIEDGSPFSRMIKKLIKTVQHWYRIFKRTGK